MIIGKNKQQVIDNIRKEAEAGNLNNKVEVDDPELSREQETELLEKYRTVRKSVNYSLRNIAARAIVDTASRAMNRDTEYIGLEKLRGIKSGAIVTSNHFNPLDNTAVRETVKKAGKKRLYIVSLLSNLAMPGWIGFLMRYTDIIPICKTNREYMTKDFSGYLHYYLNKNQWILIYPEQEMWFNYRKPRPPKRGAFYYASRENVPVIPLFVEIRDLEAMDNGEFHKTRYVVHVLDPIYPKADLGVRDNSIWMMKQDYEQKKQAYEEAYGKALTYEFTEEDIAGWVPQETEEGSDR